MSTFRAGKTIAIGSEHIDEQFKDSKHVFIVCDPFLYETGKTAYLTDRFDALGVAYTIYSDVVPDPNIDLVADGITQLAHCEPDTLVGFGGGSAIDACKAMMFFAQQQKILGSCTFIAIPTTSGTGSEVTDFSVITDTEREVKYPLIDTKLLPDVALLDAELTATVPPAVTAATGLDVLTHAIEAIVSVKANDFSDAMAEKAIKLLIENLVETYRHSENSKARAAMHNASCMAGIAFNNAGLGLNHGMAHALGARFHIPHGMANAILLPYVIEFNAGCFDGLTPSADAYARIARLFDVCTAPSIRVSTLHLIRIIKQLKRQLAVPQTIQAAGVDRHAFAEQLDAMAHAAVADRCTETNPRSCTVAEVKDLYVHAYFGVADKTL